MSKGNNNCKQIIITKENTLIIFDWDDTLFPTTWAVKNGINLTDDSLKKKFTIFFLELDDILFKLLNNLNEYGNIIIVTNALPIWVKTSSSLLPKTYELMSKLKILSARKDYRNYSANIMDWKKMAFKNVVSNMPSNKILNIISVGDAEYEYRALIDLYNKTNNNKILKSIKLMDHPTQETLIDQLEVLSNAIPNICTMKKHLDLKFRFK